MASLLTEIHAAARDGMAITLFAMLCSKNIAEINEALLTHVESEGQRTTPLIVAAKNGHVGVVKTILNHFEVDIEQTGTVKLDGYTIEGATALWCAAGSGHRAIVSILISAGAEIDRSTQTNSTPLRAACFDGRLDIVRYLVDHHADVNSSNKYNNTCVMIACYKGHTEVVRYLLEHGANPNALAHCGATALHFGAEAGHVEVLRVLVEFGATLVPNDHGMTPLMVAADDGQAEVVQYFLSLPASVSTRDRVEALELLGASHVHSKARYDPARAYSYMWLAAHSRLSGTELINKVVLPPIPAYENRSETRNVQELIDIKDDPDAIHYEALMIRERILGEDNPDIPHAIVFRGAMYADLAQFDRCTALWGRAMTLRVKNKHSVMRDVRRFTQVFSQMLHVGVNVTFSDLLHVYRVTFEELTRLNKNGPEPSPSRAWHPGPGTDTESQTSCLMTALYLVVIFTKLSGLNGKQQFEFFQLTYKLNKAGISTPVGATLLHLAADPETAVDDFHISDIVQFPNAKAVSLLLKCGANPNEVDLCRQTALYPIVRYNKPITDFLTLHTVIISLIEAGVHVDRVDCNGLTAAQFATTGVAEIILRTERKLSLKCSSARAIRQYGLPYRDIVPTDLEHFIQIH